MSLLFFSFIFFILPSVVNAAGITRSQNNLGLVGYWPMNEKAGSNATDFSGNNNQGTLVGTPTWIAGKFASGLNFGNLSHYVQVSDSNSLDTTSNITVSAWIKLRANSDAQFIVNKDENYSLRVTSGLVRMQFWTGTTVVAVDVPAPSVNTWHHIVGVVTANDVTAVYVDGVLLGTSSYVLSGGVSRVLTNPLIFGTGFGGGYAGSIDEVRIYNRALTSSQVSSLYRSGGVVKKQANNLGLVGYWPFNEGNGSVAGDSSGFGNTGTFANNTSWDLGKFGNSTYFRGGAFYDHIQVKDSPSLNLSDDTMTISVWIKGATPNASGGIFTKGCCGGYGLEIGSAGGTCTTNDIAFLKSTISFFCLGKVPGDTKWHHVVVVQSSFGISAYVDGVGTGFSSLDTNSIVASPGIDLNIGSGQANWSGNIDELRIYDRALTSTEVADLYKATYSLVNKTPIDVVSNGLVGYWPFDGKYTDWEIGEVADLSINGNDGQMVNMSTTTSPVVGKVGQALRFNGSNSYVSGPDLDFPSGNFTISAWFKGSSFFGGGKIVTKTNGFNNFNYELWIDSSTEIYGGLYDGVTGQYAGMTGVTLDDGNWHHAVFVVDSSTLKLYLDGVLGNITDTFGGSITTNDQPIEIGSEIAFSGYHHGLIDEVRIYNRALSASEVLKLYNATK